MKRYLVLSLLCSAALSYAGETAEQKAACDSMIDMMKFVKTMLSRDRRQNLARGIEKEIWTEDRRSVVEESEKNRAVKDAAEELLGNIFVAMRYDYQMNSITESQLNIFLSTWGNAYLKRDHFPEGCFARIVSELEG